MFLMSHIETNPVSLLLYRGPAHVLMFARCSQPVRCARGGLCIRMFVFLIILCRRLMLGRTVLYAVGNFVLTFS